MFIAKQWHLIDVRILHLCAMKSGKIKHIGFILVLALLSFSFSHYVLTFPFKVKYEVSSSDYQEDNTENSKESPKELVDLDFSEELYLTFHVEVPQNATSYHQAELPTFDLAPLSPPPDMA